MNCYLFSCGPLRPPVSQRLKVCECSQGAVQCVQECIYIVCGCGEYLNCGVLGSDMEMLCNFALCRCRVVCKMCRVDNAIIMGRRQKPHRQKPRRQKPQKTKAPEEKIPRRQKPHAQDIQDFFFFIIKYNFFIILLKTPDIAVMIVFTTIDTMYQLLRVHIYPYA